MMTIAATASHLPTLPGVSRPHFAVFSDFDESFYAHEQTLDTRRDLHALRHWLETNVTRHEILFGFVTGSNIESVIDKLALVPATFLPHFVGSSLGSEIHLVGDAGWSTCERFSSTLCSPAEFDGALEHLMRTLQQDEFHLDPQPPSNHSALKRSFYFHQEDPGIQRAFRERLESLADICGVYVNCHECNPSAGDPEGSFEVDVTPKGAGKAAVVRHLLEMHGIPRSHAWGFGDSCNDLGMLQAVGNAFSLANATPELRSVVCTHTTRKYAGGILEVLQRVFGS